MKPGTNSASTSRQEEMYDRAIDHFADIRKMYNEIKKILELW